jgi:hypothetical protein
MLTDIERAIKTPKYFVMAILQPKQKIYNQLAIEVYEN